MCKYSTCPPPLSLLVSLTLLKDTGAFIQWAPKFGESGWMYTQLWLWGSGFPAGTHSPFTYFQRWPSAGLKSRRKEYMALGSRPDTLTFSTGNILLGESGDGGVCVCVRTTIQHENDSYCHAQTQIYTLAKNSNKAQNIISSIQRLIHKMAITVICINFKRALQTGHFAHFFFFFFAWLFFWTKMPLSGAIGKHVNGKTPTCSGDL